jgi:hypothetical protein
MKENPREERAECGSESRTADRSFCRCSCDGQAVDGVQPSACSDVSAPKLADRHTTGAEKVHKVIGNAGGV